MTDVLVIGGGPAGLAAAAAAAARGARVDLIESGETLGGQIWRHRGSDEQASRAQTPRREHPHGWAEFERLRRELIASDRVTLHAETAVWGIERVDDDGMRVHALHGEVDGAREPVRFDARTLVLATGAFDRVTPFPGWDLPGVVTGGAAQSLLKRDGVPIGRRVLVAGTGPFLLPVATSLIAAGSRVVGVVDSAPWGSLVREWSSGAWFARPAATAALAAKVPELAGYLAALARSRTPFRAGTVVVAAHGVDRVDRVTVADVDAAGRVIPNTRRAAAVDAICVTDGFTPRLELAIALGARLTGDRFVAVDARGATSIPGVFAAGEVTGIGGAQAALAEGRIAGHVAAGGSVRDAAVRAAVHSHRGQRAFGDRLRAAHPIRDVWPERLTDDTVICRCESVRWRELRETIDATADPGLGSLKLTSRAGLGICQGRVCGRNLEHLAGLSVAGAAGTDRRPIATPIRMGELACASETAQSAARTEHPRGDSREHPQKGTP